MGDRVVLYHRATRSALVLNPMATWLWELLGVPRTAGDLVAEIRVSFPPSPWSARRRTWRRCSTTCVQHGVVARQA